MDVIGLGNRVQEVAFAFLYALLSGVVIPLYKIFNQHRKSFHNGFR
jgi:hypothetical protein